LPDRTAMQNRHRDGFGNIVDACGPLDNDDGPGATGHCTPNTEDFVRSRFAANGRLARAIAERASDLNVLIVQAAGNESNEWCVDLTLASCATNEVITAQTTSPFIWAERNWTAPKPNPVIGVEAIAQGSPGLFRMQTS